MEKLYQKIKAIFLDIDGTFFDHVTNQILPSSMEAIQKAKENGYKIALCSGRPLKMAQELCVFNNIEWDGFIGSAGNTVYDEHLNLIRKNGFTNQELQTIFTIAHQKHLCLYVNGSHAFLTEDDPKAKAVLARFHVQIPNQIRPWKPEDSVEMISMFEGYDYDYSDFLCIPSLRLQKSSGCIVDLIKEGVNKYTGIRSMMHYWGLHENDYMAFGDSLNDKEMLQNAKLAIAMRNGDTALFPYADFICDASYQDSIQKTLQQFQFI